MKACKLFSILIALFWLVDLAVPAAAAHAPGRSPLESSAGRQIVPAAAPAAFSKLNPPDGSTQPTNPILRWAYSTGVVSFQYCVSLVDNDASCSWVNTGTSTSWQVSGLSAHTVYYWQVQALGILSTNTNANAGTWWSFTTGDLPGSFIKWLPGNNSNTQPIILSLTWKSDGSSTDTYQYCLDTTNNNLCDTSWISTGTSTGLTIGGLSPSTSYYWQVRAVNSNGSTEADGAAWFTFTTGAAVTHLVTNNNDSDAGSLRQAISDAASSDTINFNGDYTIHLASPLSIDKNLTIDGTGHSITVSGDSDVQVFSIGADVDSLIDLSVVNGTSSGHGGGIDNHGNLTMQNCTVSGNSATGVDGGGGIYNDTGANLVLNVTNVDNNSANISGGGISNYGTLTVINSGIDENTTEGQGAGIYNDTGGTVEISAASTIENNTAISYGGGLGNFGSLTLTNSTIFGNQVTDSYNGSGAGIDNDGSLTVQGSTFGSNISAGDGGAISNHSHASMNVTNSTFSGNSAQIGGAIFISSDDGTLTVGNSTLAGNSASQYGGGIYVSGSTLTVQNSILASNTGANCTGSVTDGGNNLVWDDTSCPPYTPQNPQLGALASNGGPTQTMALPLGSPAVDAYDANCPITDQRGVTRPQGAHCDIGAFELGQFHIYLPLVLR